jgi:hypothetical protein
MLEYIKTITQTMKSFGFEILDYAKDGGKTTNKAAVGHFMQNRPDIEMTDSLKADIIRYVDCIFHEKLNREPIWSDMLLIYDGDSITCRIGDKEITVSVCISEEEITVQQAGLPEKVVARGQAGNLIDITDCGPFLSQEGIVKVKETVLGLFLN